MEEVCWSSEPSVCSHTKRVSFDLNHQSAAEKSPADQPEGQSPDLPGNVQPDASTALSGGQADPPDAELTSCASGSFTDARCTVAVNGRYDSGDPELTPRASGSSSTSGGAAVINGQCSSTPSETTPTNDHCVPTRSDCKPADNQSEPSPPSTPLTNGEIHSLPNTQPHTNGLSTPSAPIAAPTTPKPPTGGSPLPAPAEDPPSQSDSDLSFASADGSPDDAAFRTPAAGRRRARRHRRVPVVDRLFGSPPAGSSAMGEAAAAATMAGSPSQMVAGMVTLVNGETSDGRGSLSKSREYVSHRVLSGIEAGSEQSESCVGTVNGNDSAVIVSTSSANAPGLSPAGIFTSAPQSNSTTQSTQSKSTGAGGRPLSSPLKSPPRSYVAASGRLRALASVPSGQRAPFVLPRLPAAPAPDAAGGGDGGVVAGFCVPRMAPSAVTKKTGVRVLRWFNRGLNDRQKSAVRRVLKGNVGA